MCIRGVYIRDPYERSLTRDGNDCIDIASNSLHQYVFTESTTHLFVHCRVTRRIWDLIKDWLGLYNVNTGHWTNLNFNNWWLLMTNVYPNRKAVASLTLLTAWEIWSERNTRVFKKKSAPSFVIFERVKREARLWALAGAKHLGNLMPRE